jgi:hypothetical protein
VKPKTTKDIKTSRPPVSLKKYTGKYYNAGYGNFEITTKNNSLFASFPEKTFWLNYKDENVFNPYLLTEKKKLNQQMCFMIYNLVLIIKMQVLILLKD